MTPWRARALDRLLADGADPIESDRLALRVGQLASPAARARLAFGLRTAVRLARERQPAWAATRLRTADVRKNGELLLLLADRIADDEPVGVRGLAMTTRLIHDPRSPLFSDRSERPLSVAALEALLELDRGLRIRTPTSGEPGRITQVSDD